MAPKNQLLGPLELQVMKVVWKHGDVSVSEVLEELREERDWHHNTVMTVMKRLAEKGLLRQYARDGRTHGYRPRISQEQVCQEYVQLVREQFFEGSWKMTIAALLGGTKPSARQQAALDKLLGELEGDV